MQHFIEQLGVIQEELEAAELPDDHAGIDATLLFLMQSLGATQKSGPNKGWSLQLTPKAFLATSTQASMDEIVAIVDGLGDIFQRPKPTKATPLQPLSDTSAQKPSLMSKMFRPQAGSKVAPSGKARTHPGGGHVGDIIVAG